jgi:hypothetical protein
MSTYTVRPGDSLSKIYKSLGYSSWQDLWNQWQASSRSKNPSLIYSGEQIPYANSIAPQTTTPAPAPTPSQQLADTVAQEVPTREQFASRFGSLDELTPDAAFKQFAEQQVTPDYYRTANNALRDMSRQAAVSGSYRVGQTRSAMEGQLNDIEKARKYAVDQYAQQQKDLYGDWYNAEMQSYMNAPQPANWALGQFDLSGYGVDNSGYSDKYRMGYNPVNIKDWFGGYGSVSQRPGQMYGNIYQTQDPLLNPDRNNIRY